MLTGKQVRVRYARDRIVPYYLDPADEQWRLVAEQLIDLFRTMQGRTRGELEEEIASTFGDDPSTLVHQGLAKLLEDRCEFDTLSGHPPEKLRAEAFRAAVVARQDPDAPPGGFDRDAILGSVGRLLGLAVEDVERGLFADLKTEQNLIRYHDVSVDHLLDRYNVALAQAVLLRAVRLAVTIHHEPPQRYRQLLRRLKFHRLLCEVERVGPDSCTLHIDGPLSLFSATQKYGLQLALFLPGVLACKNFEVKAELRWGAQKKPKVFLLTHREKLSYPGPDPGMWVPAELGLFVESFRRRVADWELREESEVFPLGNGFWVPDFRLVHKASGRSVLLEVLGFWRKSSAEKHLLYLQRFAKEPFLLAVSDQLHIEEAALDDLSAGIHRFRNMPLADEIAKLATRAIEGRGTNNQTREGDHG
jgi:predicted nuclease of restriction endonuclease-like RecB superfamily